MKILIIDDNACFARALKRALKDHEIAVITDPATALDTIASAALTRPFELVLCDAWMPDMSGLDVLAALRTQHERPIFVLMSGDALVVDAETGADAVLMKPFAAGELRALITQIRDARASAMTVRLPSVAAR